MSASSVIDAVTAIAAGRFVVVVDDEGREDEGDLVMAVRLRANKGARCDGEGSPGPRPSLQQRNGWPSWSHTPTGCCVLQ